MALKQIKNKIRSVDKTRKVTSAMEAVSAVKMRKSQERALDGRPYARAALTILDHVSSSQDAANHAFVTERKVERVLLIVITSDKGLAGSLNAGVLKKAQKLIDELELSQDQLDIICLGRKAAEYFENRSYKVVDRFDNVSDAIQAEDMRSITKQATDLFATKVVDLAYVAYTNFKSTFEQMPTIRKVLPLQPHELRETVNDILPTKGKFQADELQREVSAYTIEPSPEEVLEELFPALVNILVYHTLLEAKASEHSARMVAMKNASDKAREMSKDLNLAFNKERQALITREVSEIIGGIETMKV